MAQDAKQPSTAMLKRKDALCRAIGLDPTADRFLIETFIDILNPGTNRENLYVNLEGYTYILDRKFGPGNWDASMVIPTVEEVRAAQISLKTDTICIMKGRVRIRMGVGWMAHEAIGTALPSTMPNKFISWEDKGMEIAAKRAIISACEIAAELGVSIGRVTYRPDDSPGLRGMGPHPPAAEQTTEAVELEGEVKSLLMQQIEREVIPRVDAHEDEAIRAKGVSLRRFLSGGHPQMPLNLENLRGTVEHYIGAVDASGQRTGGVLS